MSGGHWDYKQHDVEDLFYNIGKDGRIIKRMPKLAQIFNDMSILLGDVIHDLDWDLSNDSSIDNDEEFEINFIKQLGKIIEKKYKVKIYEVNE